MRDHLGTEWVTVTEAARRARTTRNTIMSWVRRGKITTHHISGMLWLNWTDTARAEHATRGRYHEQRTRMHYPAHKDTCAQDQSPANSGQ